MNEKKEKEFIEYLLHTCKYFEVKGTTNRTFMKSDCKIEINSKIYLYIPCSIGIVKMEFDIDDLYYKADKKGNLFAYFCDYGRSAIIG